MDWESSDACGIGEVIYTTTRYRRWWQLWKPKSWTETGLYRVVPGFYSNGNANGTTFEGCHATSERYWVKEWDDNSVPIIGAESASP